MCLISGHNKFPCLKSWQQVRAVKAAKPNAKFLCETGDGRAKYIVEDVVDYSDLRIYTGEICKP